MFASVPHAVTIIPQLQGIVSDMEFLYMHAYIYDV